MDGAPATEIGVMVCGHGSRDEGACREFAQLAAGIAARLPDWPVEHGYLEFARPIIRDGLERLKARGVRRILAVPAMLFAAGHVKNDVPSVLNSWSAATGVPVSMGRDLGIDARLLRAAAERIEAALGASRHDVGRERSCLVVIGRGTSDSDANGNVAKVARMLWEGMGFAHAEIGFSGVTQPRTEIAVARAVKLGFQRIVVFPYFLFSGVLVSRIYEASRTVAAMHPEVEILEAGYLNDHPAVLDTFVERITGILDGDTAMNCALCKYRVQILGHEQDLGAPQESHHHHVEGIGTSGHHHHHDHHDHHDHRRIQTHPDDDHGNAGHERAAE